MPHWGSWTYFLLILLVVLEGLSATLLGAAAASINEHNINSAVGCSAEEFSNQ